MARGWTDTGREVLNAEGRRFLQTDSLKKKNRAVRWNDGGRWGRTNAEISKYFTPDGASTTVERREVESEALLCSDRTLKG